MKKILLITFLASSLFACQETKKVTVTLSATEGNEVEGTVIFEQHDEFVSMTAKLYNATSGKHAIHIHQNGDCSSPNGKSAGGHWNPEQHNHGKWGEQKFHKGDIGNFIIGESGSGTITKKTELWCIGCDDPKKNILGKAIIVHAGADDFNSQPSGAAGSRIACGVIE